MVESAAEPPIPEAITRGNVESKMSPSILLIMIIVAIIFFMSGVLHLLVRFLVKPNNRDPDEAEEVSALQGQLQQLFYLHDAGVEQSLIDRLPQFQYSSVMGVKDPFDCAVCLCEFEGEDRLRLLPKCSHAFHTDCIDTWLLSHSTCPLCRFNLLQGISPAQSSRFPLVCLLHEPDPNFHRTNSDIPRISTDSVVTVKLGKFKNLQEEEEEEAAAASTSSNVVDSRRCYSMGSFAYIMDHNSSFRVPIPNTANNASTLYLPRSAISEYASDSTRDFQLQGSLARTRRPDSEIEFNVADDEDKHSCYSLESSTTNATTTKRTLNWLMGRHHNKIVNSSSFSSSTIV